jgi:RNA polymerase sigma factor (sigma-70 family)
MRTRAIGNVVEHLRRAALPPDRADLSDGQLLEHVVNRREAAALAVLVRRHGPMVWAVCRRVLDDHHDAEDAFQATFLVLLRKAASIRTNVANWLYGVAHQTARKARATRANRRRRERSATDMPEPAVTDPDPRRDLELLLDDELRRLPEKYRTILVLCDLEGVTGREAARQLGLPQGTAVSRLRRARALLARRLARHGLGVSAAALAGVLSEKAAATLIPDQVLGSTIQAVTRIAGGQAASTLVAARVTALAEGVMKTMMLDRLRTASLVLLAVVLGLFGAGRLAYGTAGSPDKDPKADAVAGPQEKPGQDPRAELHIVGVYRPRDTVNHGITVEVRRTTRPIVLVLTSYNEVIWQVKLAKGVRLKQVLVSGYYVQEVHGIPAGVPVANRSWYPSDGSRRAGGFFYEYEGNTVAYREMVRKLNADTGLPVATFQGEHETDRFVVDGVRGGQFAQAKFPWRPSPSRDLTPEQMRQRAVGADLHVVSISRPADPGRPLDVEIRPTPRPVVLVLSSCLSAVWNLKIAEQARVRLIIVGGFLPQEIDGVPGDIPVVMCCHQRSHFRVGERAGFNWRSDTDWDTVACRRMVDMLNGLTGLPVSSFQGADTEPPFVVDGRRGHEHRQTEIKPRRASTPLSPDALRTLARGAELHVASVRPGAQDRARPVTIHVRPTPRPMVLALTSYDSVVWKLKLDNGVRLKAVLVGGWFDQDIDGVPNDIPLLRCHGYPFPKDGFWLNGPADEDPRQYRDLVRKLNDLTGLPLATFQGKADTNSMVVDGVRGRDAAQKSLPPSPPAARQPDADDPLADVAGVPSLDLRVKGDANKRYFLIGKTKPVPAGGFRLLVVLPGGDGSADFNPFIRRIYKNALDERWLIAQLVAPQWDAAQFDSVVWPTERLRYPAAQFTTEEFVRGAIAAVRDRVAVDPKRIFLLGWSSGGPPCYAAAAQRGSPVTGAFIAMSVFKPDQLPPLAPLKGKAFYLLQSPDDRVTPLRFAESAAKALKEAGCEVHLERYPGGHGWRGDVWNMLGGGLKWLDRRTVP